MANSNRAEFSERLRQIDGKHRRASKAYVQLVERDGILVPKSTRRQRRGIPLRGLVLTVGMFLVFKGFLLAHIGPITYEGRLTKLAEGNPIEQFGAWVMHADPITLWVAQQLGTLL